MSPEVIQRRLRVLAEALSALRSLRLCSQHEFLVNFEKYGSAERFLQIAIEVLTDLGNHVIAERSLGSSERMRDVPELLYRSGLIDEATTEEWVKMIGFRNVLVHEYVELNRSIVYEVLVNRLEIFEYLAKFFADIEL